MSRALDTRGSAIASQVSDQSASTAETIAATPDAAQSPLNTTTSNSGRSTHERTVDQTQEAVLYTVGPWASHANALQIALRDLARSTTRERQIQQQSVTSQLELESMLKERRKRGAFESFWFERLATLIGPTAALEVQNAVQRFCNQRSGGLEASHGALVQLSHDLSRALDSGNVIDRVAMSSRASDEILALLQKHSDTILSASAEQLEESFAQNLLSDESAASAVANQDSEQAVEESDLSERTTFVSHTMEEGEAPAEQPPPASQTPPAPPFPIPGSPAEEALINRLLESARTQGVTVPDAAVVNFVRLLAASHQAELVEAQRNGGAIAPRTRADYAAHVQQLLTTSGLQGSLASNGANTNEAVQAFVGVVGAISFGSRQTHVLRQPNAVDHPIPEVARLLEEMQGHTHILYPEALQLARHLTPVANRMGIQQDREQLARLIHSVAEMVEGARQFNPATLPADIQQLLGQRGIDNKEFENILHHLAICIATTHRQVPGNALADDGVALAPGSGNATPLPSSPLGIPTAPGTLAGVGNRGIPGASNQPGAQPLPLSNNNTPSGTLTRSLHTPLPPVDPTRVPIPEISSQDHAQTHRVATVEDLRGTLIELGQNIARARSRRDDTAIERLTNRLSDLVADNQRLLASLSLEDRHAFGALATDAERDETERLTCEREAVTFSLNQATEELIDEIIPSITTRTLTEEQALDRYRALRRERLASVDVDLGIPTDNAANQAAEQAFRNSLTERINAQRQADERTLNELATRYTQQLERGVTIARFRSASTPNTPLATHVDALTRQQDRAVEALASQSTIAPLLARNPQALQQLRERLSRAAQELRTQATAANSPAPDFLGSVRTDPAGFTTFLTSADGATLLRARLQAATTPQARVELLTALRGAVGTEHFSRIIQAYDHHKGIPLVADILSLTQASPAMQRDLLERCFGQGVTLFTASERERFITYIRDTHALTLENIVAERERLPAQIAATEAARQTSIDHIVDDLLRDNRAANAQQIRSARPEDQRRLILEAIHARFPALRGKNWQDTVTELRELSAQPSPSPGDPPSRAAMLVPQASAEQNKDLAARLTGHLKDIAHHDESLTRMRELQPNGQLDELALVSQSFDRLLNGLFPEYTAQRFAQARTAAKIYLETLPTRITNAQGEERARLITERDAIDWRSVSARVQIHLTGTPVTAAHSQRALELLNEFQQLGLGTPTARGSHFVGAARHLFNSVMSVEEYAGAAEHMLRVLLGALKNVDEQLERDAVDYGSRLITERENGGSDYWHDLYEERGRLLARRTLGDTSVAARLQEIDTEIAGAWLTNRTGSEAHRNNMISFAERAELARLRRERYRATIQTVEGRLITNAPTAEGSIGAIRQTLLHSLFNAGPINVSSEDPQSIGAILRQREEDNPYIAAEQQLRQGEERNRNAARLTELFTAVSTSRRQNVESLLNPVPARASLFTQSGAQRSANLSLISDLHSVITSDVTSRPSEAALRSLRDVVPADSALGRHLAALGDLSNTEMFMQRLYARLEPEDQMRVRIFLTSYDTPDIFNFLPDPRLENLRLQDARQVWQFVSTLRENQEHHELAPLLSVLPNLRQAYAIQARISQLSDAEAQTLLTDFQRVTGVSLGQRLLQLAPPNGALRYKYLLEIVCASRAVTRDDLAPLFGNQPVPDTPRARGEALHALLSSDSTREFQIPQSLRTLIGNQATERASLQVALGTMMNLRRFERADAITNRLAELDAAYEREIASALEPYGAAYIARQGIRAQSDEARDGATQIAMVQVADPYGTISRDAAQLVETINNKDIPTNAILAQISHGNYTASQMLVFETFYAHHVGQRTGIFLTGDLRRDIEQRNSARQPTAAELRELQLLQGDGALREYHLIMLTESLRTNPPQPHLTVRTMIALQAQGVLRETIDRLEPSARRVFEAMRTSEAGKEVHDYWDAIERNDRVRVAAITIRNGIETGAHYTDRFIGTVTNSIGNFTAEQLASARQYYRERYGTDLVADLNNGVQSLRGRWEGIVSSDPMQRARSIAASAVTETGVNLERLARSLPTNLTQDQRQIILEALNQQVQALPNSFTYTDGRPRTVFEYIRSRPGPFAQADAELLRQLLTPPEGTAALSPQVLTCFIMERERLVFQVQQLERLLEPRVNINREARTFRDNIIPTYNQAFQDAENRWTNVGKASNVVGVHQRMLNDQNDLLNRQHEGLHDIRTTLALLRRRGNLLLRDMVAGEDRGLTLEQNEGEAREVRARDMARQEIWVVARREAVLTWQTDSAIARASLNNADWWVNVGYTAVKTVAIIGACFVLSPVGALAFATAWNLAEKTYKVVVNGMSVGEASRQFLIDLVIDVAFVGALGCLKLGRALARSADGTVKATRWGFHWVSPFTKPSALRGVGHTSHVVEAVAKETPLQTVTRGFQRVTGLFIATPDLIKSAAIRFVGKLGQGAERWFEYSVRSFPLSSFSQPIRTALQDAFRKDSPNSTPKPLTVEPTTEGTSPANGNARSSDPLIVQVPPVQPRPESRDKPEVGQPSTPQPQPSEQLPTPREAQPTQPKDEKERATPTEPQQPKPQPQPTGAQPAAPATPSPATPDPVLPQSTQDWLAQTLSWNMWGSLVGSILGVFKPSAPPEFPPPPAINAPPPPPPPVEPPPPPGGSAGPGIGPELAHGDRTGNSYTRAVATPPQTAANSAAVHEQTAPIAAVRQVAQTQALSLTQPESVPLTIPTVNKNATATTQELATTNAHQIPEANQLQQSVAQRLADYDRNTNALSKAQALPQENAASIAHVTKTADTDTSRLAQTASPLASSVMNATMKTDSLAATQKAAPQEEQFILARRHLKETIKTQTGEIQNPELREQASLSAARRENAVPHTRSDVTQDKKHDTAASTTATKHLVSPRENEVPRMLTPQERAALAKDREQQMSTKSEKEQQQNSERERIVAVRMMEQSHTTQTHAALRNASAVTTEANERESSTKSAPSPTRTFNPHSEPIRMKVNASTPVETPAAVTVTNSSDDDSSNTSDDSTTAATQARKRRALAERQKHAHSARERAIIIHQLTTRAFDQAAKAKLLRMLISLGISEKEYRELVAKLGQQEAERLASQAHEAKKIAVEPLKIEIPVSHDVPRMKTPSQPPPLVPRGAQRTKADLYANLRKQVASTK